MTKVNLSNVSDLKPMPDGDYEATFTEFSEVKMSKASNLPMTVLTFTIQEENYQGRKLFNNLSLAPEALPFTKRTLIRMGADAEELSNPDGFEIEEILSGLIGCIVTVSVVTREYPKGSGTFNNQIKEVKPASGSMFG